MTDDDPTIPIGPDEHGLDAEETLAAWAEFCEASGLIPPPGGVRVELGAASEADLIALAEALGEAAADAWLDGRLDLSD